MTFFVGKFREGVGLGRSITDLSTPLRVWGNQQVERIKGAFRVGGHHRHGGDRWAAAKDPKDLKVMVETGRLASSISAEAARKSVRVFTPVSYAQYHQEGRGVPKRQVIVVTKQDQTDLEKDLHRAIDRMINGAN